MTGQPVIRQGPSWTLKAKCTCVPESRFLFPFHRTRAFNFQGRERPDPKQGTSLTGQCDPAKIQHLRLATPQQLAGLNDSINIEMVLKMRFILGDAVPRPTEIRTHKIGGTVSNGLPAPQGSGQGSHLCGTVSGPNGLPARTFPPESFLGAA